MFKNIMFLNKFLFIILIVLKKYIVYKNIIK